MNTTTTRVDPTLHDYLRAFARQFWPMFWVFFAVLTVALIVSYGLSPVYRSTGTLMIESPDIPEEMVQTTVASGREDVVNVLYSRVMRGSRIEELVQEFGLFQEISAGDPETTMRERVRAFRSATNTTNIQGEVFDPRQSRFVVKPIGFSVSFDHRDPATAQRVAQELVERFIAENRVQRTEAAGVTSEFLGREADRLREGIERAEQRLAEFKQEHSNHLPELANAVRNSLDRAENEIARLRQNLQTLEEREVGLRTQLLQLEPRLQAQGQAGQQALSSDPHVRLGQLQSEYIRLSAIYSSEHPDIVRLRRNIEQTRRQAGVTTTVVDIADELRVREGELDEARQRYSDDHPDVQRLERSVADLRAQLDESVSSGAAERPNNPAYIQVQGQIDIVAVERQGVREQISELQRRVVEYENRLQRMPEVERELVALNRNHEMAIQRYEEARAREARAQAATTLESEMRGERLSVSSSPGLPAQPSIPNRPLTIFIGIMLGLTAGGGLGAMREVLDTSVRGGRDVRNILEVPPLASIPYIETKADRRRHWLRAGIGTAVVSVSVVLVIVLYGINA